MIKAQFFIKDDLITGFSVSGHAGYADKGRDIVCASVTSAVQMAANTITEIIGAAAEVRSEEAAVSLKLSDKRSNESIFAVQAVLKGLRLHLVLLKEEYSDFIGIDDLEV